MARIQIAVFTFSDLDAASRQHWENALPATEQLSLPTHAASRLRQLQTRVRMRQLLAGFLACAERELRFDRDANGKPFLASHPGLSFNLSHSRKACALAWTDSGLALGIDLEDRDRRLRMTEIAAHAFSPAEQSAWRADGGNQDSWLRIWTQKEALLKVSGTGLRLALDTVDTLGRDPHPRLGPLDIRSWRLPAQCLSLAWPATVPEAVELHWHLEPGVTALAFDRPAPA